MADHLKSLLFFLIIALLPAVAIAQPWVIRTYTIADGLPTNDLYPIAMDKRGFIWIGTGNGLVRFDGNKFKRYDVGKGLPDNEIIQLCIDKERDDIWVLPFRKYPAYYNPTTDRFENDETQDWIANLPMGAINTLNQLSGGGISISSSNGKATIIHNRNADIIDLRKHCRVARYPFTTVFLGDDRYLLVSPDSLRIFKDNKFIEGQPAFQPYNDGTVYLNSALYTSDSNGIYKTSLSNQGQATGFYQQRAPFGAQHLSFTGKHLALVSDNGSSAVLIDTSSLKVIADLPVKGYNVSNVLEDDEGNIWITTNGQGLIKLSHRAAVSYNHLLPPDMSPSTVAINDSVMLCGDNRGRIVVFKAGCVEKIIDISKWSKVVSLIRKILIVKDGYYIAVEGDASLLLDKQYNIVSVYHRPILNYTDKCATLWRDTIILAGSLERAVRLDYKACRAYDTVQIRTTAINADNQGRMLVGSADGLYRKDDTGIVSFGSKYRLLTNRVSNICNTGDGLIWVGLASNYVVALNKDTIAGIIPIGSTIPGNICYALSGGKRGQLWIGTNSSLSRIAYTFNATGGLKWSAVSFGASDGIPGQINAIAWKQDTIYTATSNGLFVMHDNAQPLVHDIPIYITGIRINDRDTILAETWRLPHDLNDLEIQYSGIDLSGYSPTYQYRVNNGPWLDAGGDHLILKRLSPGNYNIEIRALKRDGKPSSHVASLSFHLLTPFWLSVWFWVMVFLILFIIAVWLIYNGATKRRTKERKQIAAEHELVTSQQQTFTALMNPHFIFNALNSIQHYVLSHDKLAANRYLSSFGRLIRMNFESAQKSYISLDEEMERLRLYLSLEKMRFGDKFTYTIEVADDVVPEDWVIPAMIIQPYLENAILHGIAPADIDGLLTINIYTKGSSLCVSIRDNGIGIENSLRQKQENGHVSKGMELIQKRIGTLRKLHGESIVIEVSEGEKGSAPHPGTRVLIVFPGQFRTG